MASFSVFSQYPVDCGPYGDGPNGEQEGKIPADVFWEYYNAAPHWFQVVVQTAEFIVWFAFFFLVIWFIYIYQKKRHYHSISAQLLEQIKIEKKEKLAIIRDRHALAA